MDRRQSLKFAASLACLAGASHVWGSSRAQNTTETERNPSPALSAPKTLVNFRVIGIGGYGSRMASEIGAPGEVVCIDYSPAYRSPAESACHWITLDDDALHEDQLTSLGRTEAMREAIDAALDGVNLVLLIVATGGVTGSRIAPLVAQNVRARGATLLTAGVSSFGFEGNDREIHSRMTDDALRHTAHAMLSLSNDEGSGFHHESAWLIDVTTSNDQQVRMLHDWLRQTFVVPGLFNLMLEDVFDNGSSTLASRLSIQPAAELVVSTKPSGEEYLQVPHTVLTHVSHETYASRRAEVERLLAGVGARAPAASRLFFSVGLQSAIQPNAPAYVVMLG